MTKEHSNSAVMDHGIAAGSWREVALSDEEFARICELLKREPTPVELGMFGAMWSEHCGYKHTRPLFPQLPTTAPWVLQGPGENAGAVDIGDGLAVVFKVESHNHPSAVEPYQGAATGVGGIVRDIFTMGARPIAILDGLRFGPLEVDRNRYLFNNVVGGIGGYGNCLGIPTVGGDLAFDASFNGNPLVNAMCAGIVEHDEIVRAVASGVGNVIMLIGADTGRDGVHGATFASVDDPEASHRGVIQVGNPFLEKLLLEACLELLQQDVVVAMQDLGAAGLTSSTVECASRGGVGAEIDVSSVPRREAGLSAYEVMLSESQERMLLVVASSAVPQVEDIVGKWGLHAKVIGTITDDGVVRVKDDGEVVAEVSASYFTDACPTYIRESQESEEVVTAREFNTASVPDLNESQLRVVLLELLSSPNICSRRPVFAQYDHTILTNTVVPPGMGDAAVLRIKGTNRGIALAMDCNSRYCYLAPERGATLAVAESCRNVVCAGGRPLAITNCLNMGNPEKPGGYFQLQASVRGIAAACSSLGVPVVSGNVSLYNESADKPVFPTPMIGCVGVLDNVVHHATCRWREGDEIFLVGDGAPVIGGSEYVAVHYGLIGGEPPEIDLASERALYDLLSSLIGDGVVSTAHDLSEGGLAVALAEMSIISKLGFSLVEPAEHSQSERNDLLWFGEAATRVLVAIHPDHLEEFSRRCDQTDVASRQLGRAGGTALTYSHMFQVTLEDAASAFAGAALAGRKEVA